MTETNRRYGYRRSPPGARGTKELHQMARVRHLMHAAPAALIDNTPQIASVLDQLSLGSCELNTWVQLLRNDEIVERAISGSAQTGMSFLDALVEVLKMPPELACRLLLYFAAQAAGGYAGQGDTGTCSYDVASALSQYGFCRESEYPYADDPGKIDPKTQLEELKRLAYDQRFESTARIDADDMPLDACDLAAATALGGRYVVAYATDVTVKFENLRVGEVWQGPTDGTAILGGHAITIVGRGPASQLCAQATSNELAYKVLNSWSANWCWGGYFLMSAKALANRYDLWIASSVPQDSGTT